MRANDYKVLSRAIEEGVAYGWRRAHKHDRDPDEDAIQNEIIQAVQNEISEWFDFDEPANLQDPDAA